MSKANEIAYQPPLPWETIVDQLPALDALSAGLDDEVRETRARLSRVVNVNPDAPREYAEASARYSHLVAQSEDLTAAIADLRKVIRELDQLMETELRQTFSCGLRAIRELLWRPVWRRLCQTCADLSG